MGEDLLRFIDVERLVAAFDADPTRGSVASAMLSERIERRSQPTKTWSMGSVGPRSADPDPLGSRLNSLDEHPLEAASQGARAERARSRRENRPGSTTRGILRAECLLEQGGSP
jgi:hypothetical protein